MVWKSKGTGEGLAVRAESSDAWRRRGRAMLKSNISRTGPVELTAAIANLNQLDRATLGAHWRTLYGSEAPRRLAKSLLIGAVAYRLQERALGGLAASTRRRLGATVEEHVKPAPARRALT